MAPRIKVYRAYRGWLDKDPLCYAIGSIIKDEKLTAGQVSELSGVAPSTITNWTDGPTRKPSNVCSTAVSGALGYVRHDRLNKDGTVEIAYDKVRNYDWRKELERAADFWIKQNSPVPKRRRRKRRQ